MSSDPNRWAPPEKDRDMEYGSKPSCREAPRIFLGATFRSPRRTPTPALERRRREKSCRRDRKVGSDAQESAAKWQSRMPGAAFMGRSSRHRRPLLNWMNQALAAIV